MSYVTGFDVSHWQPPSMTLATERVKAGDRFVWVKSSQGGKAGDEAMKAHHANFGAEGLKRGPYHFYDFRTTPEANAENMLRHAAGRNWELPYALDAEQGSYGTKAGNAGGLLKFLELVEQGTGRVPVVYTGPAWWKLNVEPRSEFSRYPLWMARYPNALRDGHVPPEGTIVPAPAPWSDWTVWQYSDSLGRLDRNVCTLAALDRLTGTTSAPQPPQPRGPLMALTDDEQTDLYAKVKELHADYAVSRKAGTTGAHDDGSKRWQLGVIFNTVRDLRDLLPKAKG